MSWSKIYYIGKSKQKIIKMFREQVLFCQKIGEQEMHKRNIGVDGEVTVDELTRWVFPEMQIMLDMIDGGEDLPEKEGRYIHSHGMAWRIWEWKESPLLEALYDLDIMYKTLPFDTFGKRRKNHNERSSRK